MTIVVKDTNTLTSFLSVGPEKYGTQNNRDPVILTPWDLGYFRK